MFETVWRGIRRVARQGGEVRFFRSPRSFTFSLPRRSLRSEWPAPASFFQAWRPGVPGLGVLTEEPRKVLEGWQPVQTKKVLWSFLFVSYFLLVETCEYHSTL